MRGYGNEMASPLLLRHPSSLEHDTGVHPERVARIEAIEHVLSARDWLHWDVRESPAVERDVLRAVHPDAYVERIAALSMGFCLFNNAAVAARRALDRWGAERVLVIDWDVHHGNGTNDIFHAEP